MLLPYWFLNVIKHNMKLSSLNEPRDNGIDVIKIVLASSPSRDKSGVMETERRLSAQSMEERKTLQKVRVDRKRLSLVK